MLLRRWGRWGGGVTRQHIKMIHLVLSSLGILSILYLLLCICRMSIRRDHILEDAYDQIMKEPARNLQRNRLEIQFTGEEG